jgi:hypothetical protein
MDSPLSKTKGGSVLDCELAAGPDRFSKAEYLPVDAICVDGGMELPGKLPDQVVGKDTPAWRQFIVLLMQGFLGNLKNGGIDHPGF